MKRLIALALLLLVSVSCNALSPSGSITYRVSGSAKHVSLTYENSSGGTSQQGATLPWSYERSASKGDFLYVSAQIDTSQTAVPSRSRSRRTARRSTTGRRSASRTSPPRAALTEHAPHARRSGHLSRRLRLRNPLARAGPQPLEALPHRHAPGKPDCLSRHQDETLRPTAAARQRRQFPARRGEVAGLAGRA